MVTTTTLQPVASLIFRAASRAFISSGLVMVCMDARFRVPSGIHRHLTGGVGNLLDRNNDFHVNLYLLSYFTPRRLEMTIRWTSMYPRRSR